MHVRRRSALQFLWLAAVLGALAACAVNPDLPQGYAIVYGVSEYASVSDLDQPDDDAFAITALLEDQGFVVIGGPRVNAQATKANLLADFAVAAASADSESRFFFYFAGHGYGQGMEPYYGTPPFSQEWADYLATLEGTEAGSGRDGAPTFLFLHEADPFSNVELTIEESITNDELASLLATVPSRHQIVVIDACHSGGFIGADGAHDAVPSSYGGSGGGITFFDALDAATLYLDYAPLALGDGRQATVLAASGAREFSYEGDFMGFKNGVFTHYFLQTPFAADRDYDGYVTVTEAYAYASAAIASEVNHRLTGDAKFLPRVSGGAMDFVLFETR